jgi:hypothetical protein
MVPIRAEASGLERKTEHAEIGVQAEDGRGARVPRRDRTDAIDERQTLIAVSLHQIPRPSVQFRIGVADAQAAGCVGLVDQGSEGQRRSQTGVVAKPRRGLGDDQVRRQEGVSGVTKRPIVIAHLLVCTVAAPDERDQRSGVDIDDPQRRSLGAP